MKKVVLLFFLILSLNFSLAVNTDELLVETCDTYWEGYVFNEKSGECELEGASGCVSLFEYETKNYCEDANTSDDDFFEGYEDEKLKNAGSKPGDTFYFIDKFFDKFADQLSVKEERVAEIKELIEEGDIESAKEVLREYMELAEELEKEIDPGQKDEAKRSAAAIRNAMKDIRDRLPPGERGNFVSEIMSKEHSIATTAEIAHKIKGLCEELADLDPDMFYSTCKVDEEGPEWQKDMYKDLTKDQKKEAQNFARIMKQCFKTSGQDCACGEIPFPEFVSACLEAVPLATKCEIESDEDACDKLDDLEMPGLPPHLQEIMNELEDGMMHEKYEMHMPKECVKVGISDPKECGKFMIEHNSPEECKQALLDSECDSEFECRSICDKIMMEKHAPECAEEGLSPEECKKNMKEGHLAPICKEKGLGDEECGDFMYNIKYRDTKCQENQIHDYNDCQKFLEDPNYKGGHEGPMINFDCKNIADAEERLECFDKATSGFNDYEEGYREIKEKERECADKCHSENKAWDFTGGNCVCKDGGYDYPKSDSNEWSGYDCSLLDCKQGHHCEPDFGCISDAGDSSKDESYEESECKNGCSDECPGASETDCVDDKCECYYEDDSSQDESGNGGSNEEGGMNDVELDTGTDSGSIEEESRGEGDFESSLSNSGDDNSAGITGNVFLDYYE